jgi:hypothetical protein
VKREGAVRGTPLPLRLQALHPFLTEEEVETKKEEEERGEE